jgi:hypothetical protein
VPYFRRTQATPASSTPSKGSNALAKASFALAVPQGIAACLQLTDKLAHTNLASHVNVWPLAPAMRWCAVIGGVGCASALALRISSTGSWTRSLWRPLGCVARFRLESSDRPTDVQRGHYSELITEHAQLLLMTDRELARRACLHIWEVVFLRSHPDFVPRYDVTKLVRAALMVPDDWPRHRYGSECTKARLLWYHSKGVSAWTAPEIEAATMRNRAAKLRVIEMELRDRLQIRKKVRNGN